MLCTPVEHQISRRQFMGAAGGSALSLGGLVTPAVAEKLRKERRQVLFVWLDTNNNGLKDVGESGMNAVTVQLYTPGADNAIGGSAANADTLVATTTTNASGFYQFTNLAPGRYEVRAAKQTRTVEIVAGKTVELDFEKK